MNEPARAPKVPSTTVKTEIKVQMAYRVPRGIIPNNYQIEISPDLGNRTFEGFVVVATDVVGSTTKLICNCADLSIIEVLVDGQAATYSLNPADETLEVDFGGTRSPGPLKMSIRYSGVLNDQLRGFYASTFSDEAGNEQVIATTQFQSTDARRAFPCWDEPDLKASFDITLVVDDGLLAISNGAELARTTRADGRVSVRFATTMIMSTYLVAFVVGPLEITEPVYAGDVPIRIVHRPGRAHLTSFALEVAVAALQYFDEYYGLAYPSDKLDMVALPDFAMGAMENLGCVTYREVLLLVDPDAATQPELQEVADVVNHELAHMWFGDLVTMSWWNGIWLNEAFATFMEMKATDAFRPVWQRWIDFGMSRSQAFDIDGLRSTRPVEFHVDSPDDAEAMFDVLTYQKGAAVVRMLEQWLGEETFRDGIRQYLSAHAYGNTETHDLWDALEHVAQRPVTSAMETWIFQGGFPSIEVRGIELHQHRFGYSAGSEVGMWHIPVQLRSSSGEVSLIELSVDSTPLDIAPDEIVTFNHRGHGFYRVKLPPDLLRDFGLTGTAHLEPVERFGLVDDTWALTLADQVSLADFFALLRGFSSETDVSVWQRIIAALAFVRHVGPDEMLDSLATRVGDLSSSAREVLGDSPIAGEPARTRQLRGALFGALGTMAPSPERTDLARNIHADDAADPELLAAAVLVIAANGGDDDFADFRHRFETADSPQEEIRYLYALPKFPGLQHLDELVDMCLGDAVRTQNAPFVLAQALTSRDHGPQVWSRIKASWPEIVERFPSNTIDRMLSGIRALTEPSVAAEVAEFFENRPLPQSQMQLDQHLERLTINTRFRDRVHADLAAALKG